MATAPERYCLEPGCHQKGTGTRCAAHQQQKRQVETRYQQGAYGRPWRRLRDAHIRAHPFCAECEREGREVLADEVDHIVPHRGDAHLMRDTTNLQSLCRAHHSAKTAREVGLGR